MEEEKKPGFFARVSEKLVGSKSVVEREIEKPEDVIEKSKVTSPCGPDGCYLVLESMQGGVEPHYYWMLRFLRSTNAFGLGFKDVKKIKDIYTAAEASSMWGSQEQRKGLQQDKVSQYMATVGKLIKDTFQIIRELRILDERLTLYDEYNAYGKGENERSSGAVALKGTWIDLVEGGTKNPASVYGLASQVGFATLPDLFFIVHPKKIEDVDKEVKKLKSRGINRKVREVLGRKLKQFIIWKEKTENELRTRKNFVLKYLRMHFNNIKLYTNWVKPYLKAIKMLQSQSSEGNPDVSAAFETSQVELELLAVGEKYVEQTPEGFDVEYKFKKYFACLRLVFNHVALPQMAFQREYQRGPVHAGRTEIKIIPYVLTKKQIDEYQAAVDRKSFEDIEDLIPSIEGSLSAIGDELQKYLEEAGEVQKKEEKKDKQTEGILTPFTSVFRGIGDIFKKEKSSSGEEIEKPRKGEKQAAEAMAKIQAFTIYDIYKKAHGMLAP
ncbi:MAG: hypothetical protein ABIB47_05425 [Candidatus Woesearchaeota archaeon]